MDAIYKLPRILQIQYADMATPFIAFAHSLLLADLLGNTDHQTCHHLDYLIVLILRNNFIAEVTILNNLPSLIILLHLLLQTFSKNVEVILSLPSTGSNFE